MGEAAMTFYKRLTSIINYWRDVPHGKTVSWIRCSLSFVLSRASIMSIRGARSSRNPPASEGMQELIDLQLAKGHIQ